MPARRWTAYSFALLLAMALCVAVHLAWGLGYLSRGKFARWDTTGPVSEWGYCDGAFFLRTYAAPVPRTPVRGEFAWAATQQCGEIRGLPFGWGQPAYTAEGRLARIKTVVTYREEGLRCWVASLASFLLLAFASVRPFLAYLRRRRESGRGFPVGG